MKNLKKVLAMVLAFACTFTMFASAKVYEDVQPGSEFSEAITMLSDLGVIQGKTDNKYHPEDTITRAEACMLITRLMTGDPTAAGFGGAHHFKDVPAGHWASSAIGYCVVNGVAVGVDAAGTKFEPNRPIKDKEFVTMVVRALGYETPDMKQNFPFGYMSAARAIGLLDNVNMIPDTDALRGEDAQVIYNAMFADYARGAKRLNVAHGTNVETYPTLAESVWHLDRAAVGTWDKKDKDDESITLSHCKAHTWVIVGKDGDDNVLAYPIEDGNTEKDSHEIYETLEKDVNGVKAGAYKFKYEGAGDIESIRGYKVELWGAGKHGEPTWDKKEGKYVFSNDWKIKAIKTIAGQTKFDYNASKADSKRDDGEIKVDDETTLKLENASKNAKKVSEKNTSKTDRTTYLSKEEYNREKATSDKKVEAALNVRDGAKYRLMDWDNDKEIDWVVVDEASYYKVESVSSKRLTVTSMVDVTKNKKNEEDETESLTQTWKLDDDNEIFIGKDKKESYKVKYEVPEGLKEGDIIEVAYSTGWDKITGTVSVVEAENHKLDKVATKNHLVLTFDGEVTELAENRNEADTIVPENPSKYIDFDEEELGREFAIAKNRNGFIIHSDYATDSTNYMMVLDTDDGSNKVRGELGAMKIITGDNKVETNVEVVSDLMIDRKTSGNGYDKDSRHFDEHLVVGNVYKYWKDADGRITKMETVVDGKHNAVTYNYVSKNDRLTLDTKESYALEDAKAIFAVKAHDKDEDGYFSSGYIQHKGGDLRVDEDDVLAVKQADIPDIAGINDNKDDTNAALLDGMTEVGKSWLGSTNKQIAYKANNNKDIQGAVLGVDNFNKFNAGSTKVGLVTNVAFDSNGVVSLDVATNGKTDSVASAEKVKFEDIVSVKDYQNNKSVSVASRTETINVGRLMNGSNLKDYLYKNGAYAEITTDKDGKLTGVLFMDKKDDKVDADNTVIGNYYQVSRKVIADVKTGSWMSVVEGSAEYAGKDNKFKTLDTKNIQKASDFASDATYYVIDGTPTRKDKNYEGTKASILEGFDGTPDVKVGEASDIVKSEIRNHNNNGDSYNVADVASKINDKGEGDIVAVYAYGDDMDEDENYTYVAPADKFNVTSVQFARQNGTRSDELKTLTGHDNQFVVYVGGKKADEKVVGVKMQPVGADMTPPQGEPVTGLTKENFKVDFGGTGNDPIVTMAQEITGKKGYYVLTLDMAVVTGRAVTVSVVKADKDDTIVSVATNAKVEDTAPEIGGGEGSETTPGTGSEEAQKAADLTVNVKGGVSNTLEVVVTDADKKELKNLVKDDFNLTVDGRHVKNFEVKFVANKYEITSTEVPDWTKAKDIVMIVGGRTETYGVVANAPSIKVEGSSAEYELGSMADDAWYTVDSFKIKLENIPMAEVTVTDVKGAPADAVKVEDGKIKLSTTALNKLTKDVTVKFKLTDGTTRSGVKTVTVKEHKVTVQDGTFDATNKTITLNLDKAPNEAAQEGLRKLKMKAASANSIYTTGTALVKDVAVTDKRVVVTFLTDGKEKLNQAAEVSVSNVFDAVTVDGATVDFASAKIDLGKAELNVTSVTGKDSTSKVIMDLGLSKEEADALNKEIGSSYSNYIVIKSGTKSSEHANAVNAIKVLDDGKLELTVTTQLTSGNGLKYEFKGSNLYAPIKETAGSDVA